MSDPSSSATLVLPKAELHARPTPSGLELTLKSGPSETSALMPYAQVEAFRRILGMLPFPQGAES